MAAPSSSPSSAIPAAHARVPPRSGATSSAIGLRRPAAATAGPGRAGTSPAPTSRRADIANATATRTAVTTGNSPSTAQRSPANGCTRRAQPNGDGQTSPDRPTSPAAATARARRGPRSRCRWPCPRPRPPARPPRRSRRTAARPPRAPGRARRSAAGSPVASPSGHEHRDRDVPARDDDQGGRERRIPAEYSGTEQLTPPASSSAGVPDDQQHVHDTPEQHPGRGDRPRGEPADAGAEDRPTGGELGRVDHRPAAKAIRSASVG